MAAIAIEPPPASGKESALRDWLRALEATTPIASQPQRILPRAIEEMAASRGETAALIGGQGSLTYRALAAMANRYARWALDQGVAQGDVVCLLMPNRPDYVAIWLGITAVGGVVALLNTQLSGASLAHCIDVVAPKHIIVAAELAEPFAAATLNSRPRVWWHGAGGAPRLDQAIEAYSPAPLAAAERRPVTIADRALAIYTSGTTGLPKAAVVSHRRLMQWSFWFAGMMNVEATDRLYDCLPMYHAIGGIAAIGPLLVRGGSVVIAEKFAARTFWNDVVSHDCTLFQYIGELCRYLVNAPPHPLERQHRLRLCCGNGLRADIWEKFQSRFGIPRILEFYASTEGNFSLYNAEGKVGAIGRVPSFLKHRFPLALIKYDSATGEPLRDAAGRCQRCATDETGEAIGRIGDAQAGAAFEGYTAPQETERKILRDVFESGDAWYRTGDLMRMDDAGFFYFVDRIGDSFRWKGENVASSEVAAAITAFPDIAEASVYGVAVPGTEGAAGMATLVATGPLDLAELRRHLARRLPAYARPLFLRIKDRIATTATFKPKTGELQRESFDPAVVADPIYFDDRKQGAYVRLDAALYARIVAGTIRL